MKYNYTKIFFWFPTSEVHLVYQIMLVKHLVLVFLHHLDNFVRIDLLLNGSIGICKKYKIKNNNYVLKKTTKNINMTKLYKYIMILKFNLILHTYYTQLRWICRLSFVTMAILYPSFSSFRVSWKPKKTKTFTTCIGTVYRCKTTHLWWYIIQIIFTIRLKTIYIKLN
jgi:hypothetical protein